MSEPTAAARPAARPKGKTYAGLTRNQWLIVGGVFAAALGYILWRRHEAAKAATGTTTSTSTSTSTAAQLAALESELGQLEQQGVGSGGTAGSGGGTAGTSGPAAYSTATATPAGTPTASNGTASTGTGATATATKTAAGAISNLQASGIGTTTAKVSWNPASNAKQGYAYKVTQMNGTVVKSGNTSATSVSLSGLHPGWEYNFGVQGLPGGPGNNIHFTTKSS